MLLFISQIFSLIQVVPCKRTGAVSKVQHWHAEGVLEFVLKTTPFHNALIFNLVLWRS